MIARTIVATMRYEALMAWRARVLWWSMVPLVVLAALLALTSPATTTGDPVGRAGQAALVFTLLCPVGVALGLTHLFGHHRVSGLTELLDTTAAGTGARMAGALLGALGVAGALPAGALVVVGLVIAVSTGTVAAFGAGVAAVTAMLLPACLVLTSFAALLGVVLPVAFARTAAVVVWVWATVWNPAIVPVPTITGTVLSPLGGYPAAAWLGVPASRATYGLDGLLRPPVNYGTAVLGIALLLAGAVLFLVLARVAVDARGRTVTTGA